MIMVRKEEMEEEIVIKMRKRSNESDHDDGEEK